MDSIQLRYKPGDRALLAERVPDGDDNYLNAVRGDREMLAFFGKQVTIETIYNDGPGRIGYKIEGDYRHWYRPDLFSDFDSFEEADVVVDMAAFDALMS